MFGLIGVLLLIYVITGSQTLDAQNPAIAPAPGLVFHDEASIGAFVLQRWTKPDEDIPQAFIENRLYEHITVLMQEKPVLKLTGSHGIRYRIDEHSGTDTNGDGIPDLIVEAYTGGAHCCSSTVMYAVGRSATAYFKVDTQDCSGRLEDLDHDGRMEFVTCDAIFAYKYCVFADSPLPQVVYSYDPQKGTYIPNTPHFASYLPDISRTIADAETEMRKPEEDRVLSVVCVVLRPVLDTIYRTGRFEDGLQLLRRLYGSESNLSEIQKSIIENIRTSNHFVAR